MKKTVSIIIVSLILSANFILVASPVFALAEGDSTGSSSDPISTQKATQEEVPKEAEKKPPLRVLLNEPIGNVNIISIQTVCTPEIETGSSFKDGFRIKEWNCHDLDIVGVECKSNAEEQIALLKEGKSLRDPDITYCRRGQLIEADSGSGLIQGYVGILYKWAAGTIGIVAVLVIVVSGIEIIASDISGDIEAAKSRIGQSLLGLAVLFLSAMILYTINPNFFF